MTPLTFQGTSVKSHKICTTLAAALLAGSAWANPVSTTVDFSDGMQDWRGDGVGHMAGSGIDTVLGDGSPSFHAIGTNSAFQFKTFVNQSFLGDYTTSKSLTISIDVTVAELAIGGPGGQPLAQDFVLELRDYDKPSPQQAYSSVWYKLGTIGDGFPMTQHFSVTIDDTSSNLLPAGWGGFGDYDQMGNTVLPYGQTFRRILKDVDQIQFGTEVPGYFYGAEQYYNLSVDNVSISAVPEPTSALMLGSGLALLGWTAARRRKATVAAPAASLA
jgi:hypothetical protein